MKLSLTLHDKIHSVEDEIPHDSYTIDEIVDLFKGVLVSAGYHPSSVDEYLVGEYKWFGDENNSLLKWDPKIDEKLISTDKNHERND